MGDTGTPLAAARWARLIAGHRARLPVVHIQAGAPALCLYARHSQMAAAFSVRVWVGRPAPPRPSTRLQRTMVQCTAQRDVARELSRRGLGLGALALGEMEGPGGPGMPLEFCSVSECN